MGARMQMQLFRLLDQCQLMRREDAAFRGPLPVLGYNEPSVRPVAGLCAPGPPYVAPGPLDSVSLSVAANGSIGVRLTSAREAAGAAQGPFNVLIFAVFRKAPSATRGKNT